jgi:uncharacterized protein YqgV (UPF0045/DUF77 family)
MTNLSHQINASIQIVPKSSTPDTYALVDKAIHVIRDSGITHMVTPLETIVEGSFEEVMDVFNQATQAVAPHADEVLVFIKMHLSAHRDITFGEKTAKWDNQD